MNQSELAAHYRNLFSIYGDSPQACQWTSHDSQFQRLQILLNVAIFYTNSNTILDFGCGTGALADFLHSSGLEANYTGIDVIDEFLQCAASKHPGYRFCKQQDINKSEIFDYIFISGVFNTRTENNQLFFETTLNWCWEHCNKAIAFNLLSTYVDYQEDELWYKSPLEVIDFIKSNFGHRTRFDLVNSYILPGGTIASEYTVYLYKRSTKLT